MLILLLLAFMPTPHIHLFSQDSCGSHGNGKTHDKMVCSGLTNQKMQRRAQSERTNGDEQRYPDKRGSYGKGLRRTLNTGLVDPLAFNSLVHATQTGNFADFNAIQLQLNPRERGLGSPQSTLSRTLWDVDVNTFSVPTPPTLVSAQKAAEMVELYWMSLLADIPFNDYATNACVADAIKDLNNLSDFRAPRIDSHITPQTLFRLNVSGALQGPYISQFLLLDVPLCDAIFPQRYGSPLPFDKQPLNNFLTNVAEWKFIQEGHRPERSVTFDPVFRYIRTARELTSFVHKDPPQLPYLFAAYIIASFGLDALDKGNPYITNSTQEMVAEFSTSQLSTLIFIAGEMATKAAWYQKWFVHRTLRPEEYGFLVHQQVTGAFDYGLHADVINSAALPKVSALNAVTNSRLSSPIAEGSFLLAQQYPEGSPMHPSYPAGHGVCAGACVTILKAWFNEDFVLPKTFVPSEDGLTLVSMPDTRLTVGGELNKLATNIATGRNMAGVHFRCDMEESLKLGEQVAIALLQDWICTSNFSGFNLTTFDGTKITVGANKRVKPKTVVNKKARSSRAFF